jgi:hypothetical protein
VPPAHPICPAPAGQLAPQPGAPHSLALPPPGRPLPRRASHPELAGKGSKLVAAVAVGCRLRSGQRHVAPKVGCKLLRARRCLGRGAVEPVCRVWGRCVWVVDCLSAPPPRWGLQAPPSQRALAALDCPRPCCPPTSRGSRPSSCSASSDTATTLGLSSGWTSAREKHAPATGRGRVRGPSSTGSARSARLSKLGGMR